MTRTTMRRLAWPAALVALVLLFLFPIWMGKSFWLRDMVVFHYPLKAYLRSRMAAGELAAWNPYLGLGRPFLGVVQPGVLYPLDVLLLLPFPRGVDLFFALHAPIAALGMRAWLRAHDSDEASAFFGGALLALSGYYVSQLAGNGSYAVSVAWVPWAAWAMARACRGGDGRLGAALIAVFIALMLLGGDPQAAWFAAAVLACEAFSVERGKIMRACGVAAGGLVLGAALAAAQLGPALEVAAVGRPGGVALADAQHFSFPPQRLIELLWPGAFGPPYAADWPLHRLYDEGTGLDYEPWSAGVYLGLSTPLFVVVAVAQRRRRELVLALLLLASLVIAFGWHTPLFALFFRFVPGARQFRYPEKYLFVTTLAACALAPRGLTAAIDFLRARVPAVEKLAPRLRLAIVAVALADLAAASLPLTDYVPAELYRETAPPVALMRESGARGLVRLYRPRYADWSVAGAGGAAIARGTLRPDCGVDDGVAQLDAYENFPLPTEQLLWRALGKSNPLALVEILGAEFVLTSERSFTPSSGLQLVRGWPELHLVLARVTHPAPRVYLARDTRVLDDDAAARAIAASDFVPGGSAILAHGDGASDAHAAAGDCTLVDDRIERLRLRCSSDAPSYAVVGDAFFPGWRATVDGKAAPVLRANLGMRAVAVGAGTHDVELAYAPAHFTAGCLVSALALAVVIALSIRARRRR